MNKTTLRSAILTSLSLASLLPVLAIGCGAEPGSPAPADRAAEQVAEAPSALSPLCVTLQRGVEGTVRDAQLARRIGTPLTTDPDANANFGGLTTAKVGNTIVAPKRSWKTLLGFDLSFVHPLAAVISAEVTVNATSTAPGVVTVKQVTAPWDENLVTFRSWNNAQGSDVASFLTVAGAGTYSVDVTTLVQSWVDGSIANNGLVFVQDGAKITTLSTSEAANVASRPEMTICYIEISPCDGFCQNGGTCSLDANNQPVCACPPPFIGAQCELSGCPCSNDLAWNWWWTTEDLYPPDMPYNCRYTSDYAEVDAQGAPFLGSGVGVDPVTGNYTCGGYDISGGDECLGRQITPTEAIACRIEMVGYFEQRVGACQPQVDNHYLSCDTRFP